MQRFPVIALAAVFGCVVLAACGGSGRLSKVDYRSQLAIITKHANAAHVDLALGAANARTVLQVQVQLRRFAATEDQLAAQVSALKPPKDADAANAKLAQGERTDAAELRKLIPKLSKFSSTKEAFRFLNGLGPTKGGRQQDEAIAELKKLGYTKGT
jgi:hypothetical protein